MADFKIEELVSLLDKGALTKDELVLAMDKIQFQPFSQEVNGINAIVSPPPTKPATTLEQYSLLDNRMVKSPIKEVVKRANGINLAKNFVKEELIDERDNENFSTRKDNYKIAISKCFSTESLEQLLFESDTHKLPFSLLGSPRESRQSKFLNRLEKYTSQKDVKLKERKQRREEEEGKECSFHPKTNKRRNRHAQSVEEIGMRLYNNTKKQEIVDRIRFEQKQRSEKELATVCTFRPSVNPKRAKSRYMEESKERNLRTHCGLSVIQINTNENEYTFCPNINKVLTKTSKVKDYLDGKAYMRLSQSNNALKRVKSIYESCSSIENVRTKKCDDVKQRLNEFFERQNNYEQKKEGNKCKIINKVKISSTPTINRNSKKIIEALNRSNKVSSGTINSCITRETKETDKEYTFQPSILPKSKEMRPRSIDEMVYKVIAVRQDFIDNIKEIERDKEKKECTFKPEINKEYENIKSKLQLKNNIKTYTTRIRVQKHIQGNVNAMRKHIKDYKEMKECTHQPVISKFPYCIKEKRILIKEYTDSKRVGSYAKKLKK